MNRYPLWKYVVMVVALAIGLIYTLPNFFGEAPAVQVLSGKATVKLDSSTLSQIEAALAANQITAVDVTFDNSSTNANIRVRLTDTDTQLRVKDLLSKTLNSDPTDPNFVVALNLQSASPRWLTALHALPMYLGLDLRGGVHFLLQVDMAGALNKKLDSDASDARTLAARQQHPRWRREPRQPDGGDQFRRQGHGGRGEQAALAQHQRTPVGDPDGA